MAPTIDALDGARDPSDLSRPLYGAGFAVAIRRFVRKYGFFDGRASLAEFWWVFLGLTLTAVLLGVLGFGGLVVGVQGAQDGTVGSTVGTVLVNGVWLVSTVLAIGVIVPMASLTWRRLHDTNRPGWWALLAVVPWVGWIALLVMLMQPAKSGGRRFDPDRSVRDREPFVDPA